MTNVIAFSLWYSLLDRGGPAVRALGEPTRPIAFPENATLTSLLRTGGRSTRTTSTRLHQLTALSPTDTMPITRWAKMVMLVQSSVWLVIAIMIVARAVNILT